MKITGIDAAKPEPIDQVDMLCRAFQYGIDKVGEEIKAAGEIPHGDAIIIALSYKLGEQIGAVPDRRGRKIITGKIEKLLRQAIAIKAGS